MPTSIGLFDYARALNGPSTTAATHAIIIVGIFLWQCLLTRLMWTTGDRFVQGPLRYCTSKLSLPPSVAGTTLLALGRAIALTFFAVSAVDRAGSFSIAVSALLSSGIVRIAGGIGAIALARDLDSDSTLQRVARAVTGYTVLLRDVVGALILIGTLIYISWDESVHVYEVGLLLFLYLCYVVSAVVLRRNPIQAFFSTVDNVRLHIQTRKRLRRHSSRSVNSVFGGNGMDGRRARGIASPGPGRRLRRSFDSFGDAHAATPTDHDMWLAEAAVYDRLDSGGASGVHASPAGFYEQSHGLSLPALSRPDSKDNDPGEQGVDAWGALNDGEWDEDVTRWATGWMDAIEEMSETESVTDAEAGAPVSTPPRRARQRPTELGSPDAGKIGDLDAPLLHPPTSPAQPSPGLPSPPPGSRAPRRGSGGPASTGSRTPLRSPGRIMRPPSRSSGRMGSYDTGGSSFASSDWGEGADPFLEGMTDFEMRYRVTAAGLTPPSGTSPLWMRLLYWVELPFSVLRWLSIPACDNKWDAFRRSCLPVAVTLMGLILQLCIRQPSAMGSDMLMGIPIWGWSLMVGCAVGGTLWLCTSTDQWPSIYWLILSLGLVSAGAWMHLLGNELVQVASSLSDDFGFPVSMWTALTIGPLAALPDVLFVQRLAAARLAESAYSGTIAQSCLTVLVALGLSLTIQTCADAPNSTPIVWNIYLVVLAAGFMLIAVVAAGVLLISRLHRPSLPLTIGGVALVVTAVVVVCTLGATTSIMPESWAHL